MLPNFWDDRKKCQAVFDELNTLKRNYEAVTNLKDEIDSIVKRCTRCGITGNVK